MKPCPRALALLFFIISLCGASAKDFSGPQGNCKISIPDDWVVSDSKLGIGCIVSANNLKGNESIGLFINPAHSSSIDALSKDSSAVKFLEKQYQDQGSTIASQQQRKVNGINFYVLRGVQKTGSTPVNFAIWLTIADGQMFEIVLDAINGDPDKSAELTAAINSFSIAKK